MTARESGAAVTLPPLAGELDVLWELILDLAEQLPEHDWVLVGGQMVMLHALAAGRVSTRASKDVDVLADLVPAPASLARCVEALQRLDLLPTPDSAGKVYRFRRDRDNATVDLLAPDHSPPRSPLRTVGRPSCLFPVSSAPSCSRPPRGSLTPVILSGTAAMPPS